MDVQLLLRLDRMAQPRILSPQADFAGAKGLVEEGMIEASHQMQVTCSEVVLHALLVHFITKKDGRP